MLVEILPLADGEPLRLYRLPITTHLFDNLAGVFEERLHLCPLLLDGLDGRANFFSELVGFGAEFVIRKPLEGFVKAVDLPHDRLQLAQFALVAAAAEYLLDGL